MSAPRETSGMGRFEGYGPPNAVVDSRLVANVPPVGATASPAFGQPLARGMASAYAAADIRVEKLEGAIKDIREYCTDAGDIGSTYVYIEVIDEILKRHGLDS